MKGYGAWEVTGHRIIGSGLTVCTDCHPSKMDDDDAVPIFISEETDHVLYCDLCGFVIETNVVT